MQKNELCGQKTQAVHFRHKGFCLGCILDYVNKFRSVVLELATSIVQHNIHVLYYINGPQLFFLGEN